MKKLLVLILGIVCVSTRVSATTDYESAAFAVNDFDGVDACGGTDLNWPINTMAGWEDGMDNINYDQNKTNSDLGVDARDFTDYGNYTWGRDYIDPYGTDFAEAVFINSHGGKSSTYSYPVMGDDNASETCYPRTNGHMEFGSNSSTSEQTNVFVFKGCSSLHYDVYDNGGYDSLNDGASNGDYAYSFKMYAGFHGTSYGSSATHLLRCRPTDTRCVTIDVIASPPQLTRLTDTVGGVPFRCRP